VNTTFEYVISVLIIALILGFSIISLNTIQDTQLQPLKEEQLRPVAERFLDKVLLSKGYPYNWGADIFVSPDPSSDPSLELRKLEDVGLAANSTNLYTIDVYKVMRLVKEVSAGQSTIENPLYVDPEYLGNLTGLRENGQWKYGFRLLMKTALNINVSATFSGHGSQEMAESFKVNVSTYSGKPAANAIVAAKYFCFYVEQIGTGSDKYVWNYTYTTFYNKTDWKGMTTLDFYNDTSFWEYVDQQKNNNPFFFLFITANYYGLQSQEVWTYPQVETISLMLQGRYLIVNFVPPEHGTKLEYPKAAHFMGGLHLNTNLTLVEFTSDLNVIFDPVINVSSTGRAYKIINMGGKNYRVYELSAYCSPDVLFAGMVVSSVLKSGGRTDWFAYASRPLVPTAIDYRSHYQDWKIFPQVGIKNEVLSRIVRIGLNSYYVELTLWRMSE